MPLEELIRPFTWSRYSKKLRKRIENPRSAGLFTKAGAKERGMHFAVGSAGAIEEGNIVTFYWLVDPEDGVIADAKFQVFGQSALIGAAEVACEVLIGKNYDQASRLATEVIDQHVRDRGGKEAFPQETYPHLNLALEAIEHAADTCNEIPLASNYVAPPAPLMDGEVLEGGYPGWDELTSEKKIAVIEQVLDADVRPYIAMDAGGVEVVKFEEENNELTIAYQGACTSCFSAVGATLSYIQQTLRNKVHPDLKVIPQM